MSDQEQIVEKKKALKSKWGDPRDSQIFANQFSSETEEDVPPITIFGIQIVGPRKQKVSKYIDSDHHAKQIEDDVTATRFFDHRCGLIKAVTAMTAKGSSVQLYLDGFDQLRLPSSSVTLKIAENEDGLDDGKPVADVFFQGYGKKHGSLSSYKINGVTLWFKDQIQLKQYVMAITMQAEPDKPQNKTINKTVYVENDSSSLWPFLGGLAVGALLEDH